MATCTVGSWLDATTFAFAWQRDGKAIARATQPAYTVKKRDRGHTLTCAVTATNITAATTATSRGVQVS